ncbi:MAG TPA: PQQ-binding-like beta-propeller repeat protein [Solirubrobacteraceae bacterium]|nr:PQQ-binding-like beta-propeller repeat protein [Solirubrobacteraceae bacterium]
MGGEDLSTSPLVLADGRLIWPGPGHTLFGLSATGHQEWKLPASADLVTPVLDPLNGTLVVADQAGQISGYRLPTSTGGAPSQLWTHTLAKTSLSNPSVAADGTIYQDAGDSLFALSPSGGIKWTYRTPKTVEVSPAVADGGVVVFGSDNRLEYGINPNGKLRWRVPIGNLTYSSPLAFAPHRVIFGNHSGQMTTLDSSTGRRISRDQGQGEIWTAAALDSRGDAYFASRTGVIFGFNASGKRLFALGTPTKFDSYPALAPDGTLLIGGDDGTLYAIR